MSNRKPVAMHKELASLVTSHRRRRVPQSIHSTVVESHISSLIFGAMLMSHIYFFIYVLCMHLYKCKRIEIIFTLMPRL